MGGGCILWGDPVQIGCFTLPSSRNLKHGGGVDIPGSLGISHQRTSILPFSSCLSVPLFDVISIAISELIGSSLVAEAN